MNSNPHETDPESLTLAPVTQPVAATSFFARHAFPILFLGLLGAAFSPIIVRLSEVGPIATAVNRMALPLPLFFALLWLRPQDRIPMKTRTGLHDFWLVVLSGAFFAADLTLWFSSVMMTSVANASMLSNMGTSTHWPRPLCSRSSNAILMCVAKTCPQNLSAMTVGKYLGSPYASILIPAIPLSP